MTMPHLMNCDHSEEWCLSCVKKMHAQLEQVTAERDELREACEAAVAVLQHVPGDEISPLFRKLTIALARWRGE